MIYPSPRIGSGMPRLVSAMSGVWAITPSGWSGLQSGLMSGSLEHMRAVVGALDPARLKARAQHPRVKSALYDGDEWYFDATTDAHIRGSGVGVFPIRGPLFDRGWCCFQGYDQIIETAEAFALEALARKELQDTPDLTAIVMPIDSPGGMCVGLWEACRAVRELRDIVPIYTVADLQIGSAAEAIACQGTESSTSRDAKRGHIGTFAGHVDISAMLAKEGVRVEYFEAPAGGVKTFFAGEKELSEAGRDEYRKAVAHYYDAFVEMVSLGRGLIPAQIMATRAEIYYGTASIAAGLAQTEETFDELLYRLEAV